MKIPEDYSSCERCKQGIVRRHSAGATCQYCGRTWYNTHVLVLFKDLENGEMFISPEYYPDSQRYDATQTEKIAWVKATSKDDFPNGRLHARHNAYRPDKPELQAIYGPLALVIPVKPLNQLPTV